MIYAVGLAVNAWLWQFDTTWAAAIGGLAAAAIVAQWAVGAARG